MRNVSWVMVAVLAAALVVSGSVLAQECRDRDRDGYQVGSGCPVPADCDDGDLDAYPGAVELCNGRDDDCDGTVDEGCDGVCEDSERRFGSRPTGGNDGFSYGRPELAPARFGFGLAWTNSLDETGTCEEVRFARFDADGQMVVGPISLREPGLDGNPKREKAVVWTGENFFVGWNGWEGSDCLDHDTLHARIQRVAPDGKLIGAAFDPACGGPSDVYYLLWTGAHVLAVFGGGGISIGLMRIDPDGTILDPCGVESGLGGFTTSLHGMATNGEQHAMVYQDAPEGAPLPEGVEIYMARFTKDLQNLDPGGRRLTFTSEHSEGPSIVWGPGEWGIAWSQEFPGLFDANIAFMRVGTDGEVIDPPGIVQVTDDSHGDRPQMLSKIIWTGQEYGILYQEQNMSTFGDIFLARVAPDGTVIEPRRLITDDTDRLALFFDAYWNGEDYTVVWQDSGTGDKTILRYDRMGCGCRDEDGDHYSSCAGADCDDSRSDINWTMPELCGDGVDNNCDGMTDCEDEAVCPALGPRPGPVENLLASPDGQSFSWDETPDADSYDAVRGRAVDLLFEGNLSHTACLAKDSPEPSLTDPETPLRSDAFLYLVRGEAGGPASCRLGSWGSAERDQSIDACP